MDYSDIKRLPIPYRRWFIDRLGKEFERKADAQKSSRPNTRDIPMGEVADMVKSSQSTDVKSFK